LPKRIKKYDRINVRRYKTKKNSLGESQGGTLNNQHGKHQVKFWPFFGQKFCLWKCADHATELKSGFL